MLSKYLLGTNFVGHNVWNQGKIICSLFPYLKGHFGGGMEKKVTQTLEIKNASH